MTKVDFEDVVDAAADLWIALGNHDMTGRWSLIGDFMSAYDRLSQDGKCDSAGATECRRVLEEFLDLPEEDQKDIDGFICERANVGPDGEPMPELSDARKEVMSQG